jgi:hypothetical protein
MLEVKELLNFGNISYTDLLQTTQLSSKADAREEVLI